MPLRTTVFETVASAIPPLRLAAAVSIAPTSPVSQSSAHIFRPRYARHAAIGFRRGCRIDPFLTKT